jgi:hypothetical protein
MSEVLSLADARAERDANQPHLGGPAKCLACNYDWIAVSPIGQPELECPSCKTYRGVFAGPIIPKAKLVWTCGCGNDVFILTPEAIICAYCAKPTDGYAT